MNNTTIDAEFEEALQDIKEDTLIGDEVKLILSTDGKHTVMGKNVKKVIEVYDYVKERYGTKQAQAVKEYNNAEKELHGPEWCDIHKVVMKKYSNEKGSWYSHKHGEVWCNGKVK